MPVYEIVGGKEARYVIPVGPGGGVSTPDVIDLTPTITAGAYAAGRVVGGVLTIAGAVVDTGGKAVLQSLVIFDDGNVKADLSLLLFRSSPASALADNAAFAWGSGDRDRYLGRVDILASDYATMGGKAAATLRSLGLVVESDTTAVYAYLLTTGTPTYASTSGLTLKTGWLR